MHVSTQLPLDSDFFSPCPVRDAAVRAELVRRHGTAGDDAFSRCAGPDGAPGALGARALYVEAALALVVRNLKGAEDVG